MSGIDGNKYTGYGWEMQVGVHKMAPTARALQRPSDKPDLR